MLKNIVKMALVFMFSAAAYAVPVNDNSGVNLGAAVDWSTFKYPEVIVVDKDNGESEGSKLVKKMIPDLESFIKDISLGVCKTLYKSPEEVPAFETLVFELEDTDGVAYKVGNNPQIKIHMSTRYLADQYRRMGDEAITYEIAGINWHELTHAYQHSPRTGREDRFGLVESMADAVRITAGYHKTRSPRPGGSWNSGYTTGGFFIQWVQDKYDKEFIYKLNQSCKTGSWSWDKACNDIVGKGIQMLWDEYQWHLKGGGSEAVARFTLKKNIVGKGQDIQLVNNSFNEPESFKWEFPGATPSSSTDSAPVIRYNAAGQYDITLSATNKNGSTTETVKSCVLVMSESNSIVSLSSIRDDISCTPEQAMPREGVNNLVDDNPETKYCVRNRSSQITYSLKKPARLYVYSITSANDAPGRDPASWALQGSNDNNSWEDIDKQEDVVFAKRYQKKQFLVKDNTKKFSFYRLDMKSKSDPIFQFADLELVGAY